jgi:hypothetical protein
MIKSISGRDMWHFQWCTDLTGTGDNYIKLINMENDYGLPQQQLESKAGLYVKF